jgi:hypothetical protein
MKNKHLVLLFLLALGIGLLTRQFPWFIQQNRSLALVEVDPARVDRILVQSPGKAEWSLEYSDSSWLLVQGEQMFKLPNSEAQLLLNTFCGLHALEISSSTRPDTLGLSDNERLVVGLYQGHKRLENIYLGYETQYQGKAASYLQVGANTGIYLSEGYLRRFLDTQLEKRPNTSFLWEIPAHVESVQLNGIGFQTVRLLKKDTLPFWQGAQIPIHTDSLQAWNKGWQVLNGAPQADYFDETLEGARKIFQLEYQGAATRLVVQAYRMNAWTPDAARQGAPGDYFIKSSQMGGQYFKVQDTLRLQEQLRRWQQMTLSTQ